MLIMNQANTLVADCTAIYISSDEDGIWVKGALLNGQEVVLGRYDSIDGAQHVLNEFMCTHA